MQRAGSRWRWGAAALLAAWLALGAGAEQTPRVPPQPASGEPRTVFSTSRRFTVTGFPAGTAVDFYLGDVKIGSATADSMGEANLELAAERGQTVPVPTGGTIAQARLADGRVLVSGSF